jgi:putative ABC transport system substrate-binding protein
MRMQGQLTSRRSLILGLALVLPALRAFAQSRKPYKIGWLKIQDRNHTPGQLREFTSGLEALGHHDGRTFVMEYRFADGDASRLGALAEELVRADVDLILATSQPAVDAARRVTNTIPIAGRMTDDPVRSGAAQSLARPAGNVTGVYSLLEEMSAKRLALLKQAAPDVRRVGALLTMTRGATAHWFAESQKAARELKLDIHPMDVRSVNDLDGLFANAAAQGINGLLAFRNPTVVTHDRRVIELANRYRMPGIFDAREFVDAGAFMSYGPNLEAIFRRLAAYVDRIIKGAKAGDLPIEQPTIFELVINFKTAKALGINVPDAVLVSANEVIE